MSLEADSPAEAAMRSYYAARAREYEQIYLKPERQSDLRHLEQEIPWELAGRQVLEIACGTGYWTQFLARQVAGLLATDLTTETLKVARTKALDPAVVRFAQVDAFALSPSLGLFDGAFAGFWWSHLAFDRVDAFLASLTACLKPGAKVLLLDNRYVPGSSTPISRQDAQGNTFQMRTLQDGSRHEVLKNFPDEHRLMQQLGQVARTVEFRQYDFYWLGVWEYSGAVATS
jgi:ubiquinone/menaquinone biosynthesis C-methylase UbiE